MSDTERVWVVWEYRPVGDGRGDTRLWQAKLCGPQPTNHERLASIPPDPTIAVRTIPLSEHTATLLSLAEELEAIWPILRDPNRSRGDAAVQGAKLRRLAESIRSSIPSEPS